VEKETQPAATSTAPEPELLKPEGSAEPVLMQQPSREESKRSFEFDMATVKSEPLNQVKEEPANEASKNEMRAEDLPLTREDDPAEQLRKSRERIEKLKRLSYQIGSPSTVVDMEREPAYKRRNVNLDTVPHSSQANVSRYTLSNEEDKRAELRQNNSFLHDNVD
jgi:cell division protein FtsZ